MPAIDILAAQIRRRTAAKGWALYELADYAGIARAHIYQLVNRQRSPTLATLERIAAALECEPWELIRPVD